jgi:TRAP-type C4-dicarboxylate transport system permease small subunit
LGTAQIVLRNFFSIGFAWSDGLARLAVLWLGLLGALAASRDGRHITMGALARVLPPRLRVVAGVAADAFGAVVSAALAWAAWGFVSDSREFGDTLLGDLPAWWFQAIMPVAFALIAWQFVVQAVKRLRGGYVAESPL